jgi:hypothetical protein
MSSEVDSNNFLIVLKKISNQKERSNQFKQYEDYIVKQALSFMKSNNSDNKYGKSSKSHLSDSYNETSSSASSSKLDKQTSLSNNIISLKELIGIENGYCWTTYLMSLALNCIKRITGSNSNNDVSILITRNLKYPLINPLLTLLTECLVTEPEDQGSGYSNMIMNFFFHLFSIMGMAQKIQIIGLYIILLKNNLKIYYQKFIIMLYYPVKIQDLLF